MANGFGTVFDDLQQTASKIVDVVTGIDGLPWDGSSGNYGNSDVQAGWGRFIENARSQVCELWGKANEHSDQVRVAAARYQASDEESQQTLSSLGGLLDGAAIGDGAAGMGNTAVAGFGGAAGGSIAAALNP